MMTSSAAVGTEPQLQVPTALQLPLPVEVHVARGAFGGCGLASTGLAGICGTAGSLPWTATGSVAGMSPGEVCADATSTGASALISLCVDPWLPGWALTFLA